MLCGFVATALIYAPDMKIGILPENVLNALNSDRLVQSGSVMEFITAFFKVTIYKQFYYGFNLESLFFSWETCLHVHDSLNSIAKVLSS